MIKKRFLLLSCLLFSAALGLYQPAAVWPAQESEKKEEPRSISVKILRPDEWPILTATGRLSLKLRGDKEELTFLTREGDSYYIKAGLIEELKDILSNLGEDNLVTLTGKKDGAYDVSCRNIYKFDAEGNRMIDTLCIRFYHLEVSKIIDAEKSDERLPAPKRDIEEEKRARASALSHIQQQALIATRMEEVRGRLIALNLRSPIKTMEVAFLDKDNQELTRSLLLTSSTRVAKRGLDGEEPMYISVNALRVGQEVNVIYSWDSRDERKNEALFITIMKE